MDGWPQIGDPELLERLALDDDGFRGYIRRLLASVPARGYGENELERALGYPWERPAGSFRLDAEGRATPLADLVAAEREEVVRSFTVTPAGSEAGGRLGRLPLLAIGSNAAPEQLLRKFGHFEDPEDRSVLVLTGRLHDFDVGASASPTLYGSLPATIFPSPGTRVAAALTWVTPAQFVQLTWSEVSYLLGRLHTTFKVAETGERFDDVLVFVSRFGAFTVDGAPVALAAVPAENRTARALTQGQLLDAAAALALGEGADAETLVRAMHEDSRGLGERIAATVWRHSLPFASERWTPYPGPAPA
jgi:hypothetical protein